MDAINGVGTYDSKKSPEVLDDKNTVKSGTDEFIYGIFNRDDGSNGEIDEGVFQGKTGDCWLISGVLSLSYTEEGQDLIKEAITQNEDGSYDVYFKGIDKTYTISEDELEEANTSSLFNGFFGTSKYSTGDDDMLLIELALKKIVDEGEIPIETSSGITGGSAFYLYQLFTDSEVSYNYIEEDEADELTDILNYYEEYQDSTAMTIGVADGFSGLSDSHAYAVKSYDGETLTLVNPWNSTKEIEIDVEDLYENLGDFDTSLVNTEVEEETSWLNEYENYA